MTIDTIPASEIQAAAEQLFVELGSEQPLHLMALVDHLFRPTQHLFGRWPGGRPELFNLIGHLSGAEEQISPLLLSLPSGYEERLSAVAYLRKQCNGYPMLSFLSSPLPPDVVAAQLATMTEVLLPPDSGTYLLRFADTRIIPELDHLLNAEQHMQLFGLLDHWAYVDRSGQWSIIKGSGQAAVSAQRTPLHLSDAQFASFLRACVPDNFIPTLRDNSTNFAELAPSVQHRLVCHWIETAGSEESGGLTDPSECLGYCIARLS
jgi:Domain of unknown function (DUF4123)